RRHTRWPRDWSSDVCSSDLTGGPAGGVHVTDPTNASRTLLMDLGTQAWDDELLRIFGLPRQMFAEIRSSSERYAPTAPDGPFGEIGRASCRERGERGGGGGV